MKKIKYYAYDEAMKFLSLGGKITGISGRYIPNDLVYKCQYVEIQTFGPATYELLFRNSEFAHRYLLEEVRKIIGGKAPVVDAVEFLADHD